MCFVGRYLYHLLLLFSLLFLALPAQAESTRSGQALIEALKQGGYSLYFRHEATNWSQQDLVDQKNDWLSCDGTEIRQLSEAGRRRAKQTGAAMRALKIPISEVLASPYCRTMETAHLLGLGEVRASNAVINMRVAEYFGGPAAVISTARELLARQPAPGSNRVIVAHGNVARAATPVYPGEGEAAIFKPDGEGGFVFVGQIAPQQWLELSRSN